MFRVWREARKEGLEVRGERFFNNFYLDSECCTVRAEMFVSPETMFETILGGSDTSTTKESLQPLK